MCLFVCVCSREMTTQRLMTTKNYGMCKKGKSGPFVLIDIIEKKGKDGRGRGKININCTS